MAFEKKILLTPDDYFRFNLGHVKKRLLVNPLMFLILIPAALYVVIAPPQGQHPLFVLFIAIPIALFFAVLITWMSVRSLKKQSEKQFFSSRIMQTEMTLTLDEGGMQEKSELANSTVSWADMHLAAESKHGVYLYISRLQAVIVPRRLLEENELETLRSTIGRYIEPAKNKLKQSGGRT